MNNVLDLLLKVDTNKLKRPTKVVEIKRLSELAGQPIKFTCQGLLLDEFDEVRENSISENELNINDMHIFTVLEGVKEPDLRSEELRKKYNAATPKELIKALLLPGEINSIYDVISDLSGFGDKAVEEIKN